MTKMTAKLHRKLPAIAHLQGTVVSIETKSTATGGEPLVAQLTPLLEAKLQASDKRISFDQKAPQTLIYCTVTGYTSPQFQQLSKTSSVFNPKTKKQQSQTVNYRKVTGAITIAYRAVDATTKKPIDASAIEAKFNREYDEGGGSRSGSWRDMFDKQKVLNQLSGKHANEDTIPASPADVNEKMLQMASDQIAARLVNTDETIEVLLARGSLEEAAKYGQAGLWPRMLEATETHAPLGQPQDEAYRVYNIGVAYEAMGYGAPDYKQGLTFFEQAAINYGKAIDDRPDEKYFLEPQHRIEQALVTFKTLSSREEGAGPEVTQNSTPEAQPKPAAPAAESPAAAATETLTNAQVIEAVKSGMTEKEVVAAVREAPAVKFDLSLPGQTKLHTGGVTAAIVSAMKERAKSAGPLTAAASPAPIATSKSSRQPAGTVKR